MIIQVGAVLQPCTYSVLPATTCAKRLSVVHHLVYSDPAYGCNLATLIFLCSGVWQFQIL
jgi:hypothetical protein